MIRPGRPLVRVRRRARACFSSFKRPPAPSAKRGVHHDIVAYCCIMILKSGMHILHIGHIILHILHITGRKLRQLGPKLHIACIFCILFCILFSSCISGTCIFCILICIFCIFFCIYICIFAPSPSKSGPGWHWHDAGPFTASSLASLSNLPAVKD
jgi:hypothetical protein